MTRHQWSIGAEAFRTLDGCEVTDLEWMAALMASAYASPHLRELYYVRPIDEFGYRGKDQVVAEFWFIVEHEPKDWGSLLPVIPGGRWIVKKAQVLH